MQDLPKSLARMHTKRVVTFVVAAGFHSARQSQLLPVQPGTALILANVVEPTRDDDLAYGSCCLLDCLLANLISTTLLATFFQLLVL